MNNSPFYDQESRRFVPALPKAGQVPAAAKQAGKAIRSRVPNGGISMAMPEPLFSKVLEKLEAELVAEIRRTIFDMQAKASHERVNRLLELTFKEDLLGLTEEDNPLVGMAYYMAQETLQTLVKDAEQAFRALPTSDNYAKWYGERVLAQLLDVDEGPFFCTYTPSGRKMHVVQQGDWLSKLAKRFYGNKNLWDVIYEDGTNQFARMHHPDKIVPGWRLVIP